MYLHAENLPTALRYTVIDLDTGKEIPHVIWANDDTGYYEQMMMSENGKEPLLYQTGDEPGWKILTNVRRGRIKLQMVPDPIEGWEIRWRKRSA